MSFKVFIQVLLVSAWISSFYAHGQFTVERDPENTVADRLEGKWEIHISLTQRLHATNYFQFDSPVEFTADETVAGRVPSPYATVIGNNKIYLAGYMKTPSWERPFVLTTLSGNPVLLIFVRKGNDAMSEVNYLRVVLAQGRNREEDLLFLKEKETREPFFAMERVKRPAKIESSPENPTRPTAASAKQRSGWYICRVNKGYAGYAYTMVRKGDNKESPVAISHKVVGNDQGSIQSMDFATFCKDDEYFSLSRVVSKGSGEKYGYPSFVAEVDGGGKLKTALYGKPYEVYLPWRTVFAPLVWEVVVNLPFDRERSFPFHYLDPEGLVLRQNHTLKYLGKETVSLEAETKEAHKFAHSGEDFLPIYYWVDNDRNLVKVLMSEGREFVLTTRQKAMQGY